MKKSLKEIFNEQLCIGLLAKHTNTNKFAYQPTNDLGAYHEIMSLDDEEVDKIEIITKIQIIENYYIYYFEETDTSWEEEFETMEEAIKSIIKREEERWS